MTKCGKGCMPECEYFTTGGCISPFNCPYKIETGYINSVTSFPTYTEQYNGMSDDNIKCLKAENAELRATLSKMETVEKELRERLEKAVELPRIIHPNEYEWFVQYQNKYGLIFDKIFYSERAAEARLKEIKEGKDE